MNANEYLESLLFTGHKRKDLELNENLLCTSYVVNENKYSLTQLLEGYAKNKYGEKLNAIKEFSKIELESQKKELLSTELTLAQELNLKTRIEFNKKTIELIEDILND